MIRVRFAPSPTGSLHVGGARTALFNWLFVQNARRKNEQATFVLRVEDTDKARSTDEFTKVILDGMAWLGLTYDEGPVFQADGLSRHQADADKLVQDGKAYVEDGAIRFKVTHEDITWDDAVHGPISFHGKDLEDFVILRADRTPVYNFAVVSDDIAMTITHVLRGDDHISNTPKQILLYRAFGVTPPIFGHVPMILGTDGKKLSKRHGATAVGEYSNEGVLPQAMANFLALLGWSPGHDRELFFDLNEMVDAFSLGGIQKKAAVFDPQKLAWMNAEHMRHVGASKLAAMLEDQLDGVGAERRVALVEAVLPRSKTTLDIVRQARLRAGLDPVVQDEKAAAFVAKDAEGYKNGLRFALDGLEKSADWSAAGLEADLRRIADERGLKAGAVMQPIRIALTGTTVSEPVNELLVAIGRDAALAALRTAAA
ncbi:MAG: glutamate--tRNA ligase [Gemmatimonadales bacterium]